MTKIKTIFTPKELADCARREVGRRERVYPRYVEKCAMTRRLAARQIAKMEAIAAHFAALADELEEEDCQLKDLDRRLDALRASSD